MRLLALLLLLAACDEDDPATSEHCVMVRMRVIEARFRIGEAARLGANPTLVASQNAMVARLQSENFQCFK